MPGSFTMRMPRSPGFFAEVIDVDAQAFARVAGLAGPDLFRDLVWRHDAARVHGEHAEQRKHARGELEAASPICIL